MDNALLTTIISTGGSVIVGLGAMWIATNQLGKRLDDFGHRLDDLSRRIEKLNDQFLDFKEVVNGKFAALDLEIAKLLDRSQ